MEEIHGDPATGEERWEAPNVRGRLRTFLLLIDVCVCLRIRLNKVFGNLSELTLEISKMLGTVPA